MMRILNKLKLFIRRPSFMRELVAMFTLVSLAVLTLGSILYYNSAFNILQKRAEENTIHQFKQLDYNMNAFFSQVNEISKMILVNPSTQDTSIIQELINNEDNMSQSDRIQLLNNISNEFIHNIQNYSFIHSIFLYTENGDIVGRTNSLIETEKNAGKQQFIFTSGVYDSAIKNYPHMVWTAGNKITDIGSFNNNELDASAQKPSIISAVRGIKSIYSEAFGGVLVINVDQYELAKTYSSLFDSSTDKAYIVDASGKIISSIDSTLLGKTSNPYSTTGLDKDYGSFTLKEGDVDTQVIYYKIKSVGWTLLEEVPLSQYANDTINLKRISLFIFLLNFFLIFLISVLLIKKITKPLNHLTAAMKNLGKGNLGITVPESFKNEFGMLSNQFNQMSKNIVELVKEKEEIQEEKRKQEMLALQTQINPHFIYNTVNTIKYMAIIANASNIVDSLSIFGNLLRPLFKSPSNFCRIDEEMEYLQNYVKIMNYRYGNIIRLNMEIPPELMEYKILRFLLQPILENSIQHGMLQEQNLNVIHVKAVAAGENIEITIRDNGRGMPLTKLEEIRRFIESQSGSEECFENGIGLYNINQRLKLHFGHNFKLKIDSTEGKGTSVFLTIPFIQ